MNSRRSKPPSPSPADQHCPPYFIHTIGVNRRIISNNIICFTFNLTVRFSFNFEGIKIWVGWLRGGREVVVQVAGDVRQQAGVRLEVLHEGRQLKKKIKILFTIKLFIVLLPIMTSCWPYHWSSKGRKSIKSILTS